MKNIGVNFSGGRTSALMCKLMLEDDYYSKQNLTFAFSNTGKERKETLEFVDQCDRHFGLNLIWLEAKVNPILGEGTTYTKVDFASASRNGEPFEAVLRKFGIPNQEMPRCSQELKERPLQAYYNDHFGAHITAIGMRFDELRRVNRFNPEFCYPMVEKEITVRHVRDFWNGMPFDLELKDYEGNCDLCWKKSRRKLLTLIRENPGATEWWAQMERDYGFVHTVNQDARIAQHDRGERSVFFRGKVSAEQMISLAQSDFVPVTDPHWRDRQNEEMDREEACLCGHAMGEEGED